MRVALIGVVNSAKAAFEALVASGADIVAVYTADVRRMVVQTHMEPEYFVDFVPIAAARGIPVYHVVNVNDHAEELRQLRPDVIYVVGWPQIIRQEILSIAPCIGMHPAPLPKRRGGAPANWQIIDGETSSAVTLLRLGPGIDDGDILVQVPFEIGPDDYIDEVMRKVCDITHDAIRDTYPLLASGKATWTPQNHSQATVMRRRRPEDGLINWNDSAKRIANLVRAISHPFPGAFTYCNGRQVKVWRAHIPQGYQPRLSARPGEVLLVAEDRVMVSTRDYCVAITELEIEPGARYGPGQMAHLKPLLDGKVFSNV